MLDNWLSKSKIKNAFENFVKRFFYGKLSANQFTIIGLVLGLASAVFIFLSGIFGGNLLFLIVSLVLMIISFFFDAVDGAVARFKLEKPSKFGGILDIFCDRTVEIFVIMAIISTDPINLMWPGIFSLAAIILCITMFLVVAGAVATSELKESQKAIYYRIGLMERSETFIFFILIIIIIPWRFFLLWIFASLIFLTAILRLIDAYKMFNLEIKSDTE
jgi:phosphatidylglycerophosphate synthase